MRASFVPLSTLSVSCALIFSLLSVSSPALAHDDAPKVEVLISSPETFIGQPLDYPEGQAEITAAIVTMEPGQTTGWHTHEVPMFAYMLEGELTVDYGEAGKRIYTEGDSLLEAVGVLHDGENTSDGLMRVLIVFAGSDEAANTVAEDN